LKDDESNLIVKIEDFAWGLGYSDTEAGYIPHSPRAATEIDLSVYSTGHRSQVLTRTTNILIGDMDGVKLVGI